MTKKLLIAGGILVVIVVIGASFLGSNLELDCEEGNHESRIGDDRRLGGRGQGGTCAR